MGCKMTKSRKGPAPEPREAAPRQGENKECFSFLIVDQQDGRQRYPTTTQPGPDLQRQIKCVSVRPLSSRVKPLPICESPDSKVLSPRDAALPLRSTALAKGAAPSFPDVAEPLPQHLGSPLRPGGGRGDGAVPGHWDCRPAEQLSPAWEHPCGQDHISISVSVSSTSTASRRQYERGKRSGRTGSFKSPCPQNEFASVTVSPLSSGMLSPQFGIVAIRCVNSDSDLSFGSKPTTSLTDNTKGAESVGARLNRSPIHLRNIDHHLSAQFGMLQRNVEGRGTGKTLSPYNSSEMSQSISRNSERRKVPIISLTIPQSFAPDKLSIPNAKNNVTSDGGHVVSMLTGPEPHRHISILKRLAKLEGIATIRKPKETRKPNGTTEAVCHKDGREGPHPFRRSLSAASTNSSERGERKAIVVSSSGTRGAGPAALPQSEVLVPAILGLSEALKKRNAAATYAKLGAEVMELPFLSFSANEPTSRSASLSRRDSFGSSRSISAVFSNVAAMSFRQSLTTNLACSSPRPFSPGASSPYLAYMFLDPSAPPGPQGADEDEEDPAVQRSHSRSRWVPRSCSFRSSGCVTPYTWTQSTPGWSSSGCRTVHSTGTIKCLDRHPGGPALWRADNGVCLVGKLGEPSPIRIEKAQGDAVDMQSALPPRRKRGMGSAGLVAEGIAKKKIQLE